MPESRAQNLTPRDPLLRLMASALLWLASFGYAAGVFLSIQRHIDLAPTAPVAVGRLTVERASKAEDYLSAILFFLIVAIGTVAFRPLLERLMRWSTGAVALRSGDHDRWTSLQVALFSAPVAIAPLFFLTTRKEGWAVLFPLLLAAIVCRTRGELHRRSWLRELLLNEQKPFVGLVMAEAAAWLIFRYLVTGRRIGHIPTLFLELSFLGFFLFLALAAALLIARIASLATGTSTARAVRYVAVSGTPLLLLPFGGLTMFSHQAIILGAVAAVVLLAIALQFTGVPGSSAVRRFLAFAAWPAIIFAVSYASTHAGSSWVDLFHRGETLGPASDYLAGKRPYLDVFVLHGALEDGLLDAWLMEIFGRAAEVAAARIVVVGALALPTLFLLGFAMFDSIPLALTTVAVGMFTFVDNPRIVFQIAAAALLIAALKQGGLAPSPAHSARGRITPFRPAFAAGILSGLTIFYSLDIGLYTLASSVVALTIAGVLLKRWAPLVSYFIGAIAGALPMLLWLFSIGALGAFFETSFLTVPSLIDATWSLPFPNLSLTFRDLSLRAIAEFVLGEKMRFVFNPLVLVIAVIVLIVRLRRHRSAGSLPAAAPMKSLDLALLVVTTSALFAQRSALGRADFQHQHFAAFLLPPILVALALLAARRMREFPHGGATTAFRGLLTAAVAGVLLVVLWVPDLLAMRLDALTTYRPRVSRVGFTDKQGDEVRERVSLVRRAVEKATRRGDAIFDFSNQPALYFFLDRRNPTRFYQVPVMSPPRFQTEVIRQLEESKPKIVVRGSPERYDRFDAVSNDLRAQAVAAYLDDHYEMGEVIRGIELWRRKTSGVPRFELTRYTRRIALPDEAADWADERLIFPSVGNLTGAGGSLWRGDLALHNPFEKPLQLNVRYAGGTIVDRTLRIAPHTTTLLRDVVGAFFDRPGTRGMITIRYPGGRRPVATLTTYDVSRPASGYVEQPLSTYHAATGGTDVSWLTIPGVAAGAQRRVNVGVVNTGSGIVRFKLHVRAADGSIVGNTIESGIPENGSHLLVDAEPRLDTRLDGEKTIHVELLEGTAIAYASVVDGMSGAHFTVAATPSVRR